jgi:hypothetical protein
MSDPTEIKEDILDAFASACDEDDRVLAAFVGGSLATGNADVFSDLDLYAIIRADAYEEFQKNHAKWMAQLGEPVFLEHFDEFGFDMLVFIFENGVQGELGIAKPDKFIHIHGGPFKVLVDKEGLLDGVSFPWQRPTEDQQVQALRKQMYWFWRDLSLFSVAMGRSQLWTAMGYLESMRQRCVNLARMKHNFEQWVEGYEKLEQALPDEELSHLEESFSAFNPEAIADSAAILISFYRRIASRLSDRYGIDYPLSLERVVLRELSRALTQGRVARDDELD